MFKLTGRSGRRNARATGGTPRITGLTAIRPNSQTPHPRRPAFIPETPQEQTFDGKNSRLSGLED